MGRWSAGNAAATVAPVLCAATENESMYTGAFCISSARSKTERSAC